MTESLPIESHPWEPFVPQGATVLIMGTFPPGNHRWAFDFYYPNPTNDFWRVMGLVFRGDKSAFWDATARRFRLEQIKEFLTEEHIAMNDTVRRARRLRGNASDKYLEVVEPVPLHDLMQQMPACRSIVTTGEKAAGIVAELTGTEVPAMGCSVPWGDCLIWRMPSTSRAYPLPIEQKAALYARIWAD